MADGRTGVVHSINVSNGGVPKLPCLTAWISRDGLAGDRQRNRRYHGGPERAVVLFSWDRIRALQAEGHPITAGSIGENLTLDGIEWSAMTPGTRVAIGDTVLELTRPAAPCAKIAGSFREGAFERVSEKVHPGWSRVCARVVKEGTVTVGDAVLLAPAGPV